MIATDLPVIFQHQLDPEANRMAAFTVEDPGDRNTFEAHWKRVLADQTVTKLTILANGEIAGNIIGFNQLGQREVGYWLGKEFWGRGIATEALSQFLELVETRPMHARAAKDNVASLRVLEKCGFVIMAENCLFSNARGEEVEEWVLRLE
jgi:RimJ/RimL family protein N-acetyltransferase